MRIVVPDDFPPVYTDYPGELDPLRKYGEVQVYDTRAADRDELRARLQGATAVINVRAYTVFDADLLSGLPDLKMLSIMGTGTDNVDLQAAAENGIVVTNAPETSTHSVAELTIALMLAAARHIPLTERKVREGEWFHKQGIELYGKTLGVVGLGAIGQTVARVGNTLGMRVVAWSYRRDEERARACGAELVEFDDLIRESDVVSLHLRASPQANGIIGRREFSMMKQTAILVNTARGALVDEEALANALREGRIFAAGVDVYQREPLPADSPFRGLDNIALMPHAGWITDTAFKRLMEVPVDNVVAYFEGRPAHVVNPAALDHERQKR